MNITKDFVKRTLGSMPPAVAELLKDANRKARRGFEAQIRKDETKARKLARVKTIQAKKKEARSLA